MPVSLDEKALGKKLQLARKHAGLTQQELCQAANLSYSTLAKIERGAIKSPSVFTVAAIAQATNARIEDLLELASEPSRSGPVVAAKKRSKTGIRFVYFDCNGVLVRFYHRAFTEISRATHRPADAVETLFWRYNEAVNRSQMSLEQFNTLMGRELEMPDFNWQKFYMENVEAMPGMDELLAWVAEHYEVGILSNTMPGFIDELINRSLVPNVKYKSIIDSSKIGAVKPEAKIYEIAQQVSGVEPNEILFIDDSRTNLIAADKFKWHVMWFDDYHPAETITRIKQALEF